MATYTTQKSQTYAIAYGQGSSRNLVVDMCSVAMTTAMIDNTNDAVELLWVPKGATIVGVEFRATDMDTNVSPTLKFDVGDAGDQDRLIAATTAGQTATLTTTLEATGFGYTYTTDTKILAYVNTASATGAAGTIYFRITYFVDSNFTLANAVVS